MDFCPLTRCVLNFGDRQVAEAEKKCGDQALLLDHPIIGPLRGQEWRKFHWAHGNHHLKQIARLCRGSTLK